jgi:hypothetical protein
MGDFGFVKSVNSRCSFSLRNFFKMSLYGAMSSSSRV